MGCLMYVSEVLRCNILYAVGQMARLTAKTQQDPHGGGEPYSSLPCGDNRLKHHVQEGRLQASSLFPLQLGQHPDNGKSTSCHLSMLCDALNGFISGLQGVTCHADFGGVASRVGSGDEGISVLLEHAD